MGVCGVLMPLAGLLLMNQEVEEGNHELLLLTRLTRWQVVLGKFFTLWGLSILTFTSLLPYVVGRYFIGGIEWSYELANAGTVLSVAAVLSAGTLAASGFKNHATRLGAFVLFLFAAGAGGGLGMIGGAMAISMSASTPFAILGSVFYHFSVICTVACYSLIGMQVARSRLRLATMSFELKPDSTLLLILGLAPFLVGMVAASTCGFGSIIGTFIITFVAWSSDQTRIALT